MLHIYVDQISERLIYTLDFVFEQQGIAYELTNDLHKFSRLETKRLNYSDYNFEKESIINLTPSTFLFEDDIVKQHPKKGHFNQEDCLAFNGISDPLASIFYYLSRYEEYTNPLRDDHGRFSGTKSLSFQYGWLEKLMVDRWVKSILNFLFEQQLIASAFEPSAVDIRPSFDIDNTYAYQWKNGSRKLLSMLKDYSKVDRKRLKERKLVAEGKMKDPYDTFDYIEEIATRGFKVNVFWLLGDYTQFDRNFSHDDPRHQRLIQEVAKFTMVGIHPSYKSHVNENQLSKEVVRLHKITKHPTRHSRQHFLKFSLPTTFRRLINCGIEHDYSMGFADVLGFRAGTLRTFRWFDLEKNSITPLKVHPIAYMDGTLNDYLKLKPKEAIVKIDQIYSEAKQFGGQFFCLWHNETIGEYGRWKGWKSVLEHTLSLRENE